mmetsp:Transcript_99413/g.176319  ORF Transcript_99413/g.176319 Transcript_99413/m.176319 type:complete len:581 (+) Transcript_99413:130-1872(+)
MNDAHSYSAAFLRGPPGYGHQDGYPPPPPPYGAASSHGGYAYAMQGGDFLQPWSHYGPRSGYPLQPRPQAVNMPVPLDLNSSIFGGDERGGSQGSSYHTEQAHHWQRYQSVYKYASTEEYADRKPGAQRKAREYWRQAAIENKEAVEEHRASNRQGRKKKGPAGRRRQQEYEQNAGHGWQERELPVWLRPKNQGSAEDDFGIGGSEEESLSEQPPAEDKPHTGPHPVGPLWRVDPSGRGRSSQNQLNQDRRSLRASATNPDIPAPEPDELLAALESLYEDRLEPSEDLVLRRLHERTGSGWSGAGLRQIATRLLRVELVERGPITQVSRQNNHLVKGSVAQEQVTLYYLQPEPQGFKGFVNPSLLNDEYPAELWDEIQQHIKAGGKIWDPPEGERKMTSRYILARSVREHIPALKAYCLGEICHIVQLAVRVHNLLGYRDGRIVPFEQSVDNAKLNSAESLQPIGLDMTSESWVTSWDEFREQLRQLLAEGKKSVMVGGEWTQGLPLSALKAVFKKVFDKTLSETALGHTKLSTLLDDPRLEDVCCVIRVGAERFIMPASMRGSNSDQVSLDPRQHKKHK